MGLLVWVAPLTRIEASTFPLQAEENRTEYFYLSRMLGANGKWAVSFPITRILLFFRGETGDVEVAILIILQRHPVGVNVVILVFLYTKLI